MGSDSARFRAVLFDLFGTLVDLPFAELDRTLGMVADELKINRVAFLEAWAGTYTLHEEGRFTATEHAFAHAAQAAGCSASRGDIARASTAWRDFQQRIFVPAPGVIDSLMNLLRISVRIGVVTNCPPEIAAAWPATAFTQMVDIAVFSCAEGVRKPDPSIYQRACCRIGIPPRECLFVGDGGSRELSGAVAAGLMAAQLRRRDEPADSATRYGRETWDGTVVDSLDDLLILAGQ